MSEDPYLRSVPPEESDWSDQPQQQPLQNAPQQMYQQTYPQQPVFVQMRTVPTSGLAVAGFIVALFGVPYLGLILCWVALPETKHGQRGGHGLAIAGMIINGLWSAVVTIYLIFTIIVLIYAAASMPTNLENAGIS